VDAKNSTAVTTIPRAKGPSPKGRTRAHRDEIEGDKERPDDGSIRDDGSEYFSRPSRADRSFTTRNRGCAAVEVGAFKRAVENTAGRAHYFSHHQGAGVGAVFPSPGAGTV